MSASISAVDAPRTRRQDEAVDLAARAAARHGISADAFRESVVRVRDDVESYHRALHVIESRKVRLRTQAGPGRSRDTSALPAPGSVDPWTADIDALPHATRVIAWCPDCLGSGAVKCPQCRGQKRGSCGQCRKGQVDCGTCAASGEVEAWLEVERATRQTVTVHPMTSAARAHPRVGEADDFDADPAQWPDTRAEDTGMRAPMPSSDGLKPKLSGSERVVSMRVQRFHSVVFAVAYATALSDGVVQVGGSPLEVSDTSDWRPVELRRAATVVAGLALAACAGFAAWSYPTRHAWYAQRGHGLVVGALALAMAVAGTLAASGFLLAPRARTPFRAWVPAALMVLLAGAAALVVKGDRPRVDSARAALARGDVAGARLEGDALRALDLNRAEGEAVLDAVHLRAVRDAAPDAERMAARAREPFYRDETRAQARRAVTDAVAASVATAPARDDPDALARAAELAADFSPELRERLLRDAAVMRARRCAESGDGACAHEQTSQAIQRGADPAEAAAIRRRAAERVLEFFRAALARADEARDPQERLAALRAALPMAAQYEQLTHERPSPTADELRGRVTSAEIEATRTAPPARAVNNGRHHRAHR